MLPPQDAIISVVWFHLSFVLVVKIIDYIKRYSGDLAWHHKVSGQKREKNGWGALEDWWLIAYHITGTSSHTPLVSLFSFHSLYCQLSKKGKTQKSNLCQNWRGRDSLLVFSLGQFGQICQHNKHKALVHRFIETGMSSWLWVNCPHQVLCLHFNTYSEHLKSCPRWIPEVF